MSNLPKSRRLWRLVKTQYTTCAFDGEGAFRFGGRWNSRGQGVVYASGSLSLAVLEMLVHLDPAAHLPELSAISIEVPADLIATQEFSSLDAISGGLPWSLRETRTWGDEWASLRKTAALEVPSAIVPNESNYLINPKHSSFAQFKLGKAVVFPVDTRLFYS